MTASGIFAFNCLAPCTSMSSTRFVQSVAFSPDGSYLASTGLDSTTRIWPLWAAAAHDVCARVWRNLSLDEWRLYVGEYCCPAPISGIGPHRIPRPAIRVSRQRCSRLRACGFRIRCRGVYSWTRFPGVPLRPVGSRPVSGFELPSGIDLHCSSRVADLSECHFTWLRLSCSVLLFLLQRRTVR